MQAAGLKAGYYSCIGHGSGVRDASSRTQCPDWPDYLVTKAIYSIIWILF